MSFFISLSKFLTQLFFYLGIEGDETCAEGGETELTLQRRGRQYSPSTHGEEEGDQGDGGRSSEGVSGLLLQGADNDDKSIHSCDTEGYYTTFHDFDGFQEI